MAKWIEIAGDNPSPEEELTTQEFYEQLREAIADLPEVFRTTIVLRNRRYAPRKLPKLPVFP